jgi:iron complex transport system permease protein
MAERERQQARLTQAKLVRGVTATIALAVAAAWVALAVGAVPLDFSAIADGGSTQTIFFQLRLPRVVLAGIVGGALAIAGAALQPALRNPLASPDIIGVSGGAALAAVASLAFLPATPLGAATVPVFAFAGAAGASALVYRLALVNGRLEPYTQVLIGVIFNTFSASLILLISAVVDLVRSNSIAFWLMGGIGVHPAPVLVLVAAFVVVGAVFLLREARAVDLLALGDESAEHLGVDVTRTRRRVFAASSLLVGAVVSLSGIVSFVGLIVPHLLRRVLGTDSRLLLPASFFAGAAFLMACDALARWCLAPRELPVGAITAMTGGPFFVYLIRRRRGSENL